MVAQFNIGNQQADPDVLYQAALSHDTRFDGRLFIAVKTTGIYCRPVCGVKTPKFENCRFYGHAAAAEKAGYRPCLVCRPELAPGAGYGATKVDAVATLAQSALRRIEDGALNEMTVARLAAEFGVTDRHLRRAMQREIGITPIELAQTQRLLHAKQMLTETNVAVTDVAYASGFDSLRRFNALFKSRYRLAPSDLRKKSRAVKINSGARPLGDTLSFRIDYRPPFNWPLLRDFLGARAIPGVEAVVDGAYLRVVDIGDCRGWVHIAPNTRRSKTTINALTVTLSDSLRPVCMQVVTRMKTVFDIRANGADIDSHLSQDKLLAPVVRRHAGMRLPGAFDGFELLLRAILGQQVSVKGATTLAGRCALAFGDPLVTPFEHLNSTSPSAARIAEARIDRIQRIGMPRKRAETIRLVARQVACGDLHLAPGGDPVLAGEQLTAIPGIGQWTADYVAMRALAWPDAFPVGDLGIKKALGLTKASEIMDRSAPWRPWRAYAAMYLWLSLATPSGG